jgi:Hint domain
MDDLKVGKAGTTRRGLLSTNIKAIAVIAAGALVTRLTPAKADPGQNNNGGNGNGNGNGNGGHGQNQCFLRGTKIQTVEGERRVEDLVVGDLLPTVFGGARPIQWIVRFRRTRLDPSKPWQNHARPVRVMKSALFPNIPHSDLFLTSGHALLLDGVLVTAGSLINGTTIAPYAAEEYEELEFFQIKLETHDAIFAEGAACETLLRVDATDYPEYVDKYGPAKTQDAHCAPIFGNGARSEIRWRARSAMSRWLGPQKVDIIREHLEERSRIAYLGAN